MPAACVAAEIARGLEPIFRREGKRTRANHFWVSRPRVGLGWSVLVCVQAFRYTWIAASRSRTSAALLIAERGEEAANELIGVGPDVGQWPILRGNPTAHL